MKRFKNIVLVLFIVAIAIQLIQPAPNKNGLVLETDINKVVEMPKNIEGILKTSCYDCHSNNTDYPWYSKIQPGGWWMASHIKKGKEELNFSEFGSYSNRRQQSKLKSIIDAMDDGTMPIPAYTWIHKNAILSNGDKMKLTKWASSIKDSLAIKN